MVLCKILQTDFSVRWQLVKADTYKLVKFGCFLGKLV